MAPVARSVVKELHRRTRLATKAEPRSLSATEQCIFEAARRRAMRDRIGFKLSEGEFELLVIRAGGRCEETHLPFSNRKVNGLRYRPNRMSIDRLSNASGYSLGNVWLVHAFVNMARGAATLQQMHVMKALSLARMGALVGDPAVLQRGTAPETWQF